MQKDITGFLQHPKRLVFIFILGLCAINNDRFVTSGREGMVNVAEGIDPIFKIDMRRDLRTGQRGIQVGVLLTERCSGLAADP